MVTDSCFLQGWESARIYVPFSVSRGLSGGLLVDKVLALLLKKVLTGCFFYRLHKKGAPAASSPSMMLKANERAGARHRHFPLGLL